ncbi:MAG: capsid protein [Apis picorna-like virus 1]|nr:MAG: capsid protein [Apis picorna-like virus 1]
MSKDINIGQTAVEAEAYAALNTVQDEQNLHFVDNVDDMKYDIPDRISTHDADSIDAASLGEFLSRPVKLYSFTADQTAYVNSVRYPWFDFFNNVNIKRKLDNFGFIQCDLHIKIVVNASPFLYGAHMVSYRPLQTLNATPPLNVGSPLFFNLSLCLNSQTPHIWILPQKNMAGEMVLPWFYHKNWLDVTSATDLSNMGVLYFQEVVPLKSANLAVSYKINYQVYAWASNVKLTGATSKLSVQSKRMPKASEWGDRPVSKTATVIADMARQAVGVPVIGPFAKVTELGATAVSKIAALFGYSNPPVIENVMPMKNLPFHSLASAGLSEPTSQLVLDPKNELSIDPRTVDLSGIDELDVSYIAQKEMLLTAFYWRHTDPVDGYLFSSLVTPLLQPNWLVGGLGARTAIVNPPMGYIARLFTYWRGDIIFRFKAICAQFHKGRLVISWDPLDRIATKADIYTTSFTQVVDLSPDMDVSIRIPYLQARHWLSLQRNLVTTTSVKWPIYDSALQYVSADTGTGTFNNGQICVKVQNELTGPTDAAQIGILVFVSAADNFELSSPDVPGPNNLSAIEPQNGVLSNEMSNLVVAGRPGCICPEDNLTYMGEKISSIRTLLRRQVLERIVPVNVPSIGTTNLRSTVFYQFTKWAKAPGYSLDAPTTASPAVVAGNKTYSFSNHTPLSWMTPCFVGMRGSVRRSFNVNSRGESANIYPSVQIVRRMNGAAPEFSINSTVAPADTYSTRCRNLLAGGFNSGIQGQVLTNQWTQTGLQVELPHYYPYKFVGTQLGRQYQGISEDDTGFHCYSMQIVYSPSKDTTPLSTTLECYVGAGTDFTFFWFISTPLLWLYTEPTPA